MSSSTSRNDSGKRWYSHTQREMTSTGYRWPLYDGDTAPMDDPSQADQLGDHPHRSANVTTPACCRTSESSHLTHTGGDPRVPRLAKRAVAGQNLETPLAVVHPRKDLRSTMVARTTAALWDRFAAFDPGLTRLTSAMRAVLGTAAALAVLTALRA